MMLPFMIANLQLSACRTLTSNYRKQVPYALRSLSLPNTILYLDVGNGGGLGFEDLTKIGVQEIERTYIAAGSPSQFRGFAVNLANFNAWDLTPGEFTRADDSRDPYRAQNEKMFVDYLDANLKKINATVPTNAIYDSSRSGVQGLRKNWNEWCNPEGAGFGMRPTNFTGHKLTDAFIWGWHGGESDGTSNSSSKEYDTFCGLANSARPMPKRKEWSQKYFETLIRNAKPAFKV